MQFSLIVVLELFMQVGSSYLNTYEIHHIPQKRKEVHATQSSKQAHIESYFTIKPPICENNWLGRDNMIITYHHTMYQVLALTNIQMSMHTTKSLKYV